MYTKQPSYILKLTLILSFIAGFLNATMLYLYTISLTHHTGNLTKFARQLLKGEDYFIFLFLILFYIIGATITGMIFKKRTILPILSYQKILIVLICILSIIAILMLKNMGSTLCILLLSLCMGMQNAMVFIHKNTLIRTTHMTGNLSDLGFSLGLLISSHGKEGKEYITHLCLIIAFLAGAFCAIPLSAKQPLLWTIAFYGIALFISMRKEQ